MTAFRLFDFQIEAADRLSEAAQEWVNAYAAHRPLVVGRTPIPFLGHLKAVTGAGKTPILARVCADLGPAVVLWTARASAVVDQTHRKLQTTYRTLLPASTRVIRERPSRTEWERLLSDKTGLTIWTTTVASWNEKDAAELGGSETARLNMHRPHPDWGGSLSPWRQLHTRLKRPLWVVYDESHNQTPTQLDQLINLDPIGFIFASATPPDSEVFSEFSRHVAADSTMAPIADKGRVVVRTRDVVQHELLKQTLEVVDYESEPEQMLDDVLGRLKQLDRAARATRSSIAPKALYVTEQSNPPARSLDTPRPVAIWEYIHNRGTPSDEIALYTQTKPQYVPEEAEKIAGLSQLEKRHRHIIFNKALQEGWDDPEAYLCYFDDETRSFTRIQQLLGRVLRQPGAKHSSRSELNTATLFLRVPSKRYDQVINGIKLELGQYDVEEDEGEPSSGIRLRTRTEPMTEIQVRPKHRSKLTLPNYVLGEANLDQEIRRIKAQGNRQWNEVDLLSPGTRRTRRISLEGADDRVKYAEIASNARTANGEFLRRRIRRQSRSCAHLLHPDLFKGQGFEARSCPGSVAQAELADLAAKTVDQYEKTVSFQPNPITAERTWCVGLHLPSGSQVIPFKHSAHAKYGRSNFNRDELEFAKALDQFGKGVWMRNPSTRSAGYSIPLPVKVGESSSFFPDFLWWAKKSCFAIDPTGRHILHEKVRGKLLDLAKPKVVLVARGAVTADWSRLEDEDGWTMVRPPRPGRSAAPAHYDSLKDLIAQLFAEA